MPDTVETSPEDPEYVNSNQKTVEATTQINNYKSRNLGDTYPNIELQF